MKTLKHLVTLAFLTFSTLPASAGDKVTLMLQNPPNEVVTSQPVVLNAGDSAEVVSAYTYNSNYSHLTVTIDGKEAPVPWPSYNQKVTIAGPATIRLTTGSASVASVFTTWVTLDISRAAAPSTTPTNAAVIPEDATGQYQVILESSTDMITWTAANPGMYSGNTTKRFFRTRIVKQ